MTTHYTTPNDSAAILQQIREKGTTAEFQDWFASLEPEHQAAIIVAGLKELHRKDPAATLELMKAHGLDVVPLFDHS